MFPEVIAVKLPRLSYRIAGAKTLKDRDGQDRAADGVKAKQDDRAVDGVDFAAHA